MRQPDVSDKIDIFYFGCVETSGHFLWDTDLNTVFRLPVPDWPFYPASKVSLDQTYCPGPWVGPPSYRHVEHRYQIQGRAKCSVLRWGWTVLAIWDRTVDKRPGCNSNFVARGEFTFDEMVELAKRHFPTIWKRITDAASVYQARRIP